MMAGIIGISIYKLLKSKSLDGLKIDDLQLMEIKLNAKIEEINDEIKGIGQAIQKLFEKAKNATTKSEEITIANRIKTLSQKRKMKIAALRQLERELRGVSNILILKENEQDLKAAGVWEKLKKLPPEKIEKYITSITLERKKRNELVQIIIGLTDQAMEASDYDEDVEDILEVIGEMKDSNMDSKEASERVMKKEMEEE